MWFGLLFIIVAWFFINESNLDDDWIESFNAALLVAFMFICFRIIIDIFQLR